MGLVLPFALAAQILAGPLAGTGVERAHVQQALYSGGAPGVGDPVHQLHVHAAETPPLLVTVVEDAHQVDHRFAAAETTFQIVRIQDVTLDQFQAGQHLLVPVPVGVAGDDAAAVAWYAVDEVPKLASDHGDILAMALQCLQQRIETTDIAMRMMSDRFTLADLQGVYEAIMDEQLDADVFRDWVLGQGWIEQTGEFVD